MIEEMAINGKICKHSDFFVTVSLQRQHWLPVGGFARKWDVCNVFCVWFVADDVGFCLASLLRIEWSAINLRLRILLFARLRALVLLFSRLCRASSLADLDSLKVSGFARA